MFACWTLQRKFAFPDSVFLAFLTVVMIAMLSRHRIVYSALLYQTAKFTTSSLPLGLSLNINEAVCWDYWEKTIGLSLSAKLNGRLSSPACLFRHIR